MLLAILSIFEIIIFHYLFVRYLLLKMMAKLIFSTIFQQHHVSLHLNNAKHINERLYAKRILSNLSLNGKLDLNIK